ncbi:hypothetical protein [Bosea minatitlanensis]|uniref:O-antigen/teichoic acid export membrane protein n=1 Tax=Bosea minatitlanensis TaxID=128782 RepID=A0ABW0F9Q8_9HYPH|nr:hypothetical protein [Bosea minatitlanensis]MCT4496147.1 hypothetical protein [Bosea minatitlanensis]
MAKIVALGSYLYQSALALGLLIAVSNLLTAPNYVAYSLFVSIVQFADIACFQWLRSACSRFYPGPDEESERAERGVIIAEFIASSALCFLGVVAAALFDISLWLGLIGAAVAILQGGGELHLTMLRFRQEFRLFSWLQGARATILAATTLAGAALGGELGHVVAGVLAGNLVYCLAACILSRRSLPWSHIWDGKLVRRHLAYGGVSAGASVAGVLAPLGLKTIFASQLGSAAAAGPLLALDLLQRPFGMIITSLQAVRYPELVARFDREGSSEGLRIELGRYYALLTGSALLGAAGLIALLGAATLALVPLALQASFTRTAPLIMLVALLRALTHTLLSTPAHLQRRLPAILGLAGLDCILTCAGAWVTAAFHPGAGTAIAAGSAGGAATAAALGVVMLRRQPFIMTWWPVLASVAALILAWLSTDLFASDLLLATSVALAAALLFGAAPSLTFLRWIAR